MRNSAIIISVLLLCASCTKVAAEVETQSNTKVLDGVVYVTPYENYQAFRNPMKGWREYYNPGQHPKRAEYPLPYGSIIKEYMQWNMMESVASDNVDKVIEYSNHRWEGVEDINMKVIPRPYVVWKDIANGGKPKDPNNPDDCLGEHWPTDIPATVIPDDITQAGTDGYFHPDFQNRVEKLVAKLGQAWDNDPRVAYVEMGIIGHFGEHHDPSISTYWAPHTQEQHVENRTWIPGIEKLLGDAFQKAFKNKKVMVRYAYDFKDYQYGIYWDSWAIAEESVRGYEEMKKLGDRWLTQPIGGEITWNWGDLYTLQNGAGLKGLLANSTVLARIVNQIRDLHCNHLGGVTWSDFNDSSFRAHADILQQIMGYRYIINEFSYPANITTGEKFKVEAQVTNTGSSPFYYDWPVEISLLECDTHQVVWRSQLQNVKISQWLPGDDWSSAEQKYDSPAKVNQISGEFTLDDNLPSGKYIIAISVLDPAGNQPSLRFATKNYFLGGRHPMGYVSIGETPIKEYEVPYSQFDDVINDLTLKYSI